ncbi:hypothetical protein [Acinetobacter sp. 3657]|uniref:hypothetical protein n=1 Tax=Acinetobacter sp. 3657 TaxID=2817764 RepID=UPI0028542254|nr:hypothetical protein [Prolinoborus sp. 3657]
MAFSLYCLINENSNKFSLELIEKELRQCFSKTSKFDLEYEEDPFDCSDKHLVLSWGDWWIKVFYETGQNVIEDSIEISTYTDSDKASIISNIDKRIIVRFADDELKKYTNYIILMMDYLEDISNAIIFDPQKNKFL